MTEKGPLIAFPDVNKNKGVADKGPLIASPDVIKNKKGPLIAFPDVNKNKGVAEKAPLIAFPDVNHSKGVTERPLDQLSGVFSQNAEVYEPIKFKEIVIFIINDLNTYHRNAKLS